MDIREARARLMSLLVPPPPRTHGHSAERPKRVGAAAWRRLGALAALALLVVGAALAVTVTPTERASAQSVPNVFFSVGTSLVL